MGEPPGLATRMRARLRGERDAAALEALRVAGATVYQHQQAAERVRTQLELDGRTLWSAPRAVGGRLAAVWNAFVLHTLGAGLLDADYAAQPGTAGYVPPVTFDQAWSWFSAAEGWISHAEQARANPDYDLVAELELPADLPAWVDVEPCPPAHLQALVRGLPAIREHGELAVFDLARQSDTDAQRRAVHLLQQVAAEAEASGRYAEALVVAPARGQLHELIERHLRRAVGLWFQAGQLAVVPDLIGGFRAGRSPLRIDPQTLPGGTRFDPWCLTDPGTRDWWRSQPRARAAIEAMWAADPDPYRTLLLHTQIQAALDDGAIAQLPGGQPGSYFYACPWSPVWRVRRRARLGGVRLSVPQRFTLDISTERGEFVRRILRGPFTATAEVDYNEPAPR